MGYKHGVRTLATRGSCRTPAAPFAAVVCVVPAGDDRAAAVQEAGRVGRSYTAGTPAWARLTELGSISQLQASASIASEILVGMADRAESTQEVPR
jgi:hypothetical protein